jgi:hypothetical protein
MSNSVAIKNKLIQAGVRNLKEYGYSKVDNESILTDKIYSAFFSEMLKHNLDESESENNKVINDLLTEISNRK